MSEGTVMVRGHGDSVAELHFVERCGNRIIVASLDWSVRVSAQALDVYEYDKQLFLDLLAVHAVSNGTDKADKLAGLWRRAKLLASADKANPPSAELPAWVQRLEETGKVR